MDSNVAEIPGRALRFLVILSVTLLNVISVYADSASDTADVPVVPGMPFVPGLQAERGYVDTPLGQVHYQQVGSGSKVIVLLHQVPWFHIYYSRAQAELAENGLRSIAFDLPGYGLSDRLKTPPEIADYAKAIRAGLDELDITDAIVVGHHTGATVGAEIAIQEPRRVACLLLHGVPLYTPKEQAARLARPHWDQTLTADGDYLARRAQYLGNFVVGSDASRHWSLLSMFITGPTEWYGHHAVFRYDMAESLRNIDVPVGILSNAADLLDFTVDRVRDLRPDFNYHRFDSKSSNMPFDDAGTWALGVIDALGSCQ